LISVKEALNRIIGPLGSLPVESVPLEQVFGRTLAEDILAGRATPPFDTSAMDGYALCAADIVKAPVTLKVIGEAPAGRPYPGTVNQGEALRIFTGSLVPNGADTVVIQEVTSRKGDAVTINSPAPRGANIRRKGRDFDAGDTLLSAGKALNERDIALIAAANRGSVALTKSPTVALLATGDELVSPGEALEDGSVINSNIPALSALIRTAGGTPAPQENLPDNLGAITAALEKARQADIIVTLGGASVGDYDFVQDALKAAGGKLDFWKIAMKPGKPLIFGALDGVPVIGLPGNPVSAYVTAFLFLLPALRRMQGQRDVEPRSIPARAGSEVAATSEREVFNLATLDFSQNDAAFIATPHASQDSARITTLQKSHCLIHRPANSGPAKAGEIVQVYLLPTL